MRQISERSMIAAAKNRYQERKAEQRRAVDEERLEELREKWLEAISAYFTLLRLIQDAYKISDPDELTDQMMFAFEHVDLAKRIKERAEAEYVALKKQLDNE